MKSLAKLHDAHSTFSVSNSNHVLVLSNGGKWRITDLLTVSNFVLAVIEVPNIKETIYSCQEEESWSGSGPATICEVG